MAKAGKNRRNRRVHVAALIANDVTAALESFDADEELEQFLEEAEVTDPGDFDGPPIILVDRVAGRSRYRRES